MEDDEIQVGDDVNWRKELCKNYPRLEYIAQAWPGPFKVQTVTPPTDDVPMAMLDLEGYPFPCPAGFVKIV